MEINWQDIFYFTSSLAMVVFLIACVWLTWFFFVATKLIKNLLMRVQQWDHNFDEAKYFISDVKLKVSKFLLKILDKRINSKTK